MKKFLLSVLALALGFTTQASATLTAGDVDMSAAKADMAIVFIAVLGVAVIAFGYKQIRRML